MAETEIFKALQPQFHEAIAGKSEVRTYKKDHKMPEVGLAISKYLAQRLAVQCKLTGYRFVSGDELVFSPKIYRAFPSAVRMFPASPAGTTVS